MITSYLNIKMTSNLLEKDRTHILSTRVESSARFCNLDLFRVDKAILLIVRPNGGPQYYYCAQDDQLKYHDFCVTSLWCFLNTSSDWYVEYGDLEADVISFKMVHYNKTIHWILNKMPYGMQVECEKKEDMSDENTVPKSIMCAASGMLGILILLLIYCC